MTPRPSNVRLAEPKDEIALYRMLSEKLFNENATFSMSPEKVLRFIQAATRNNDPNSGAIIGVIDGDGEIAGSIGMILGQFWYSDEFHVEEYWNFVDSNYRKSEYAKNLIDFAKSISERLKMVLNIGIVSTKQTEAKCRLYSRKLQFMGQFYMHNISAAHGPVSLEVNRGVL